MNTWLSLLPPFITILVAFSTRQVIPALLTGIFSGVLILHGTNYNEYHQFLDNYIVNSISEKDHIYVLLFSLFIAASITITQKNGGLEALISPFTTFIKTKKQALWCTYFSGLILFFDDYANTLVIGNTMRPITDRFKISREKLAYIVDSTSAPIASIALISTWIGAELSYIDDATKSLAIKTNSYDLFLNSIPYAYYPILTLLFIPILIHTEKDYGSMINTKTPLIENKSTASETPPFWTAFTPIFILIVAMMALLYQTGKTGQPQTLGEIIGNSNSYVALLWASFFSLLSSITISILFHKKNTTDSLSYMIDGFAHLLPTVIILTLAWALSAVISDLHTSKYIIASIPETFTPHYLPAIIFILSAIISFATGSSWGTMAVIFPLALPLAYSLNPEGYVIYSCIASVLSGAVFGDHCSPISDTTILSSMASDCDHLNHVKTQIPYAITVGLVSLFLMIIPTSNPLINLIIGLLILWIIIRLIGKKQVQSPF